MNAPAKRERRPTGRVAYVNARLIDPASGLDALGALLTEGRLIADLGPRLFNDGLPAGVEKIDCGGQVLAPGLIDMRVFTGEPGAEHKETLASASQAAAAGGVAFLRKPFPAKLLFDAIEKAVG